MFVGLRSKASDSSLRLDTAYVTLNKLFNQTVFCFLPYQAGRKHFDI